MAKDWFIKQSGQTYGPFPSTRLKALAAEGRLSIDAEVANSSNGPWHPASRIKGLELSAKAVSSAPPPPAVPLTRPHSPVAANVERQRSGQPTVHEQAVWSGRPSQVTNIQTFILCGLFCWLVIPVFVAAWSWLAIQCIRYELTTQRFRVMYGVLSRRTNELELYRVKDTSLSQSLFQRVFGLASIHMVTSDATSRFVTIHSISAPQAKQLREQIRTITEELRDRKRIREVDYN